MSDQPFSYATAVNLSVTTSSARVLIPNTGKQIRLATSAAGADVSVVFGDSTVVATVATGTLLPAGTIEISSVSDANTYVAAIAASGTATLNIVRSNGK